MRLGLVGYELKKPINYDKTTKPNIMRDFELERYFSTWEFTAKYHLTASDIESMSIADLLALASDHDREKFYNQWLGYTETYGAPDLRAAIASL